MGARKSEFFLADPTFCHKILSTMIIYLIRHRLALIYLALLLRPVYAQEGNTDQISDGESVRARMHYLEKPVVVEASSGPPLNYAPKRQSTDKLEVDLPFSDDSKIVERYSLAIQMIEGNGGVWDSQLVEQLSTLGNLQQQRLNHPAAIEAFRRAIQINRIAQGLHTPDQIPFLENMIDSLVATEDWEQADLYSDYLFFVQHKTYGINDPRLIPALQRLASWNIRAFNLGYGDQLGARLSTAQMLLSAGLRSVVTHYGQRDERTLQYLRDLARSAYYVKMYPEYLAGMDQPEFRARQENLRQKLNSRTIYPRSFSLGEAALKDIINYHIQKNGSVFLIAEAITHLADWYLIFDRRSNAQNRYLQAWSLLSTESDGDQLKEKLFGRVVPLPTFMDGPKNLEMRAPIPKVRSNLKNSTADVSFSVTITGGVRDLDVLTEENEENANLLSRLRRSVRFSKFRPVIENGRPVHSVGHVFRYRYWY